jgi:hypothetical protein
LEGVFSYNPEKVKPFGSPGRAGGLPYLVMKEGSGKGSVSAVGLSCGASTCRGEYSEGAVVTITAQALAGSYFDGWTGCDGANGEVCTMTMETAKNATVSFRQLPTISVKPKSLNLGKVKKDSPSEAKSYLSRMQGLKISLLILLR